MVPGTGCSVVGRTLMKQFGGERVGGKHDSLPKLLEDGRLTSDDLDGLTVVGTVRNPYDRLVTYYQRLAGDWTDSTHAFMVGKLERERAAISQEEYETRRTDLYHRKKRLEKRRRIIRMVGFNIWAKITALRWFLKHGKNEDSRFNELLFPMLAGVHRVMRFEHLEKALNDVLSSCGVQQNVSLPRKNVTPGKKPYTEYYSASTRWLLNRLYRSQFDRFQYEFDGPLSTDTVLAVP